MAAGTAAAAASSQHVAAAPASAAAAGTGPGSNAAPNDATNRNLAAGDDSSGSQADVTTARPIVDTGSDDGSATMPVSVGHLPASGTGQMGTTIGRLLQTAPFDGKVPLSVEAPPPPSSTKASSSNPSSGLTRDYDIPVSSGTPLAEAAHAFCAREWRDLEPALEAMVNASGLDRASLGFAGGPSPYADIVATLPAGSPEAAYWAPEGRQLLLHYCAREVQGLMSQWYAVSEGRRRQAEAGAAAVGASAGRMAGS